MDIYHKVGTTFRDSFQYTDPLTNLPTNGLGLSDFTFELTRQETGGQSTADFTLTNTDNGKYDLVSSGVSGFPATTGVYYLTIYRTSDSAAARRRYTNTIRVNSTGTGGGSAGTGQFTAVAGNGRVELNGSPVSGASIRILSGSTVLATTTTDLNGLWGPVFFPADGTYTVMANATGSSIVNGTITVSGGVATGPGTDLLLVTTSAVTTITFAALKSYARRQYKDRTGPKADVEVVEMVNEALGRIAMDSKLPWFETYTKIQLNGTYQTGTIALAKGSTTVTLTGGTWPTWAASGDLIAGNQIIPVASMDTSTQLTLKFAWGDTSLAAGSTYVLARYRYPLPTDILKLERVLWGPNYPYGTNPVSRSRVEFLRDAFLSGNGAIVWSFATANNELALWPYVSADRLISMLYYRRPAILVNDADTMDMDPLLIGLVHRAIDFMCSVHGECAAGSREQCHQLYVDELASSASSDKEQTDRDYGMPGGFGRDPQFYNPVT